MSEKRAKLEEILGKLEEEPLGPERLGLIERGIFESARLGDVEAGFGLREDLLFTCVMMGRLDKCIPAMEWCLARCDAEAGRFDVKRVLFQYKWIVEELPRHSGYSRETIDRGLDDLERRFRGAGWGMRGPTQLRMTVALTMADEVLAGEHFEKWTAMERDQGSDCEACEVGHAVRYRLATEDFEGAIATAAPLLEGELKCEEEPALTLSRLPPAYFTLGRGEEGVEALKRGLDLYMDGHQFCEARSRAMQVLLLTGNIGPATGVLVAALPQALWGGNELSVVQTCIVGSAVLDVARRMGEEVPEFEGLPEGVPSEVEELREWMGARAETLVKAFDARNGNGFYGAFWQQAKEWGESIGDGSGE